ncbi:MAG: sugar phosphate isomerase/epimerase, partial [Verrucomicrobiota bacterium]
DAVLLNGFHYFESLDEAYLKGVRKQAKNLGVEVRIGAGGISAGAKSFKDRYGSPEEALAMGVKLAKIFDTSVVNCRIGNIDDRYGDGGIEARLDEAADTMLAVRSRAMDTGVKFAFENHAGDTRSEEILGLIERVGSDLCGVMLDPGNALWAMEDPMVHLEKLGEHALCMSVRDYMLWPTPEGAMLQWTAVGEGLMDVKGFVSLLQRKCPDVPLFVESISNSPRPLDSDLG